MPLHFFGLSKNKTSKKAPSNMVPVGKLKNNKVVLHDKSREII